MIIDSHQHVFWHHRNDAELVADMDQQGIDLAWLLTWEIPPDHEDHGYHRVLNPLHRRPDGSHEGIPLSDLLLTQQRYPGRFLVGYCPYPLAGNAPGLFEAAYHIHKVRICGEWKFRVLFDDPRCINLYRKAGELNCPVVLHLDIPYMFNDKGESVYIPSWYGGTVDNLARALEACPDTNFIGHAPGFWREISGGAAQEPIGSKRGKVAPGGRIAQMFRKYPNLYADLSAGSGLGALQRDPAHAVEFMTEFADRLLFGRDYYGSEHQDFLKTLNLPTSVLDQILFKNARKLIHMDTPEPLKPTTFKLWRGE